MGLRKVIVEKLGIDVITHDPVLILKEEESERVLPVVIGIFEAASIAFSMENQKVPRPLAHDVIKDMIEQLECRLLRVEIHSISGGSFVCNLVLENRDGEVLEIDSRPSDAIAVALRLESDIFVDEDVLEQAGLHPRTVHKENIERDDDVQALTVTSCDAQEERDKELLPADKDSKEMSRDIEEIDAFLNGIKIADLPSDDEAEKS